MKQYRDIFQDTGFQVGNTGIHIQPHTIGGIIEKCEPEWSAAFCTFKLAFDYVCALLAIPTIVVIAAILLVLNPFLNPGPIFFRQSRMGQFGKPFSIWKFRTMVPCAQEARDPGVALEESRITTLGRMLRRNRLDEIPNLINVMRGEMSVIGPRPDAKTHYEYYSARVSGYPERHRVKPGITGLAQVEQGYVEGEDATAIKAKYDNLYVKLSCWRLDVYIVLRTFRVMLFGIGAK